MDTESYGSDKDGLVWGYRFRPGQPGAPVECDVVAEWLADPPAQSDVFTWLHFSLSNAASERWMRARLDLPNAFYESLHQHVGSTRLEQEGDTLVAVVHDVQFEFTFDPADVSTVSLCLHDRLLVSARLKPLRSVDRLRAAVRAGKTFRSSSELLAHLLRDQAAVLTDIVRQSTARVDDIEDALLKGRVSLGRRDLGLLRRVLVRLQRLLAPEPAAFFRLVTRPPPWVAGEDLQDLREAAEEFAATVTDSVALTERVKLLQEELSSITNEQTGRTLFVLTVVTVLAVPANLIAGLLGMNVGGIPFANSRQGFLAIVIPLLLLTGSLAFWALKRGRQG